jgi:hypothetical protein
MGRFRSGSMICAYAPAGQMSGCSHEPAVGGAYPLSALAPAASRRERSGALARRGRNGCGLYAWALVAAHSTNPMPWFGSTGSGVTSNTSTQLASRVPRG